MAETPSEMIPLGTKASDFDLLNPSTNAYLSLKEIKSPIATVIMFICNHCPYVKHIQKKLVEVVKAYQKQGISFVAICSNDTIKYPQDAPDSMRETVLEHNYSFPYLFDETQEVAKAYRAACTPDFYIFDKNLACVYRGRFDDATPGNRKPVTGKDLCIALDHILKNEALTETQFPSLGCNIKWKNNGDTP